jgi:DNA-binding YbaB/EbfC family protein
MTGPVHLAISGSSEARKAGPQHSKIGVRRVMKNLGQMMKQAQQLQAKMGELQAQLASIEVTGSAGGGMVNVVLSGKGDVRKVKIDPSIIDPNEVEVLEDLIVAACNDAKGKVEAQVTERMAELTGGLQLPPGLNLPI